jgi:Tfp pilus assembly protein PilV
MLFYLVRKGITLIELLLAIVLLMVIVLGAGTFSLGSRRFLQSSERKTKVLNDLTFILERISKSVLIATGDINNQGITCYTTNLRLRVAINQTTGNPDTTPADYSDDRWVEFRVNPSAVNTLQYCSNSAAFNSCNSSYQDLTTNLVRNVGQPSDFKFYCNSNNPNVDVNQVLISNLQLRYDISQPYDPMENPQVGMTPQNVIYSSLLHSKN